MSSQFKRTVLSWMVNSAIWIIFAIFLDFDMDCDLDMKMDIKWQILIFIGMVIFSRVGFEVLFMPENRDSLVANARMEPLGCIVMLVLWAFCTFLVGFYLRCFFQSLTP